jgi:anaerobic selenocysteine-containing dehydrogenase
MKIDRRSFLSLGVGVAAGTALSPLPWKLTDDLSIWTQTWPWTPVPPRGKSHYVKSVSTLCSGGCGVMVRKIDDRGVKVEGLPGYPANPGGLCPQCLSGMQYLYGPTAIASPLKRAGERGEGRWAPISWDAAIAEVADRLGAIRAAGTPEALSCIVDRDVGTVPALLKRFLTVFGSPNFMWSPSYLDGYDMAFRFMHGVDAMPGFDLENADFLLSLGSGVLDGWGSPGRMFRAHSRLKEIGGTFVQVEPRLSNSAMKADQWIPVNPGAEAMVALGMCAVLMEEGLFDAEFVKQFGAGFEDFTDESGQTRPGFKTVVTQNFSARKAGRMAGVGSRAIEKLAKDFVAAKAPVAVFGRGEGDIPGAAHEYMAVHALNALAGRVNRPGGVWAMMKPDYIRWREPELDVVAKKGLAAERVDGAGSERFPHTPSLLHRLPHVLNSAEGTPVQALLVHAANPCYTLPDTAAAREALGRIPFIVSFSAHMDETAAMADLILPNHNHFERWEDVPAPPGLNQPTIGLSRPVVPPQNSTRHVGDTVMALARKMGAPMAAAFPWENYEACLEKTMGRQFRKMLAKGYDANAGYEPIPLAEAFKTPDKKFHFISEKCRMDENGAEPVAAPGDRGEFPLLLIPYDSMRLAHGPVADSPFLIKTVESHVLKDKDGFVEMNAKTAGEFGLAEGVMAVLSTPKGRVKVRVHASDGILPGVIAMPRGLGHTAGSDYLVGKGVNVNSLIGPVTDAVSGLDAAWGIRANIRIA